PACVYASALCCRTPSSAPSPYTTLFRSVVLERLDEFGRNLRLVMAVRDELVCRDSELGTDLENRLLLRRARYCDIGLEFSHEGAPISKYGERGDRPDGRAYKRERSLSCNLKTGAQCPKSDSPQRYRSRIERSSTRFDRTWRRLKPMVARCE